MLAPPPALRHPRLPPSLDVDSLLGDRDADGTGRDRLAGLLDPAQRVRPRPDRARRVRARCRCSRCPRASSQTGCRVSGVVIVTSLGDAAVAALLLVVTLHGAHELWQFVALAALTGAIGALGSPAQRSLVPELVPAELLTAALALRSIAGQAATIGGPALGGLLFALQPEAVYAASAAMLVLSALVLLPVTRPDGAVDRGARERADALRGRALHPRHAGDPRCDHARPVRCFVRWGGRTAAALCEVDPPHRPVRPRRPAQHGRRRRARSPASGSRGGRSADVRAARCSSSSGRSARAWSCSVSRAGSGCPLSHSR